MPGVSEDHKSKHPIERILILGAGGRDFHNFNLLYKNYEQKFEVVGFTYAQIPQNETRRYPPGLSGPHYEKGLPIWSEDQLEQIIKEHSIDRCLLAYSDLPHTKVMELAARCLASGCEFFLTPPKNTMLKASKPVIAIVATRTGCGKSQTSRYVINALKKFNKKCVLVRHPMPYSVDLDKEAVQRFAQYSDLDDHDITVEEREEYEQHIRQGTVVYAGVDYERILHQAENEADIIIFDGGNNDTPFYKPNLWICVADPHRAGHELCYYPGDVNFRMADIIVINKVNTADPANVAIIEKNATMVNPNAKIYHTNSEIRVDRPDLILGKRVLVVDDGPTLTHGGMSYGAGKFAAEKYGAAAIVDPRPHFAGSFISLHEKYPHLGKLIPAMGYWPEQVKDLEQSINAVEDCDTVVVATPMDLKKIVHINKPVAVVTYEVQNIRGMPCLEEALDQFMKKNEGK